MQLVAIGEPREDGQVELFFELNGQPRVITVPDRAAAATVKARRKAESGTPAHIAAPMPGVVSNVNVVKDQEVRTGDVLLTLEAMKMVTVLHAPHDGAVADLFVAPGAQVDSKDLLVDLRPSPAT
ncbi:pyruvate carboxylase [Bradyrhizobium sp. USDA 3311]